MAPEPPQLVVLDLVGVFVFALAGALAAVRARLDVFGVLVLASVTALGGGVLRDTLLGQDPPASLRHWPYLAVPVLAGLAVFFWHPQITRLWGVILLLDAAGLGLFTITGTRLALDSRLGLVGSVAIGLIAGIGGGVLRDVLLRQIPLVLRREIYAVAALVGAGLVCLGRALGQLHAAWEIGAAIVVFGVRVLALRRHWSAPQARAVADGVD